MKPQMSIKKHDANLSYCIYVHKMDSFWESMFDNQKREKILPSNLEIFVAGSEC